LFTLTLQTVPQTDSAGTLTLRAGALEPNLFNVRHKRSLPLLDLPLGEVCGYPYNLNRTRIPRLAGLFNAIARLRKEIFPF
jgi:hypothetical protein